MAKQIVTQDAVTSIANALTTAGEEPTILSVQAQIGGGSYTTVKRYLDSWKAARQQASPTVAVPVSLAMQGTTLVQSIWAHALAEAEAQTQQARADAAAHVTEAHATLAEAERIIAQLEATADLHDQRHTEALQTIAQLQRDRAETQTARHVADARIAEQARQIDELRNEGTQRRDAAQLVARLEGEIMTLRRQITDQAALIERISTRTTP